MKGFPNFQREKKRAVKKTEASHGEFDAKKLFYQQSPGSPALSPNGSEIKNSIALSENAIAFKTGNVLNLIVMNGALGKRVVQISLDSHEVSLLKSFL